MQCPACARQQEPRPICSACGSPLGAEIDCFAALGVRRRLSIDPGELERTYHELSRRVHPDRFAGRPAAVKEASLRTTALLTRSYRTLRDPLSRGLYWLELNGEKLAESNKQVPGDLAHLVFEVQEQLEELGAAAEGDERRKLVQEITGRRRELVELMDEVQSELERNFASWDDAAGGNRAELFKRLKMILSRITYLRTLLRDVDRQLEAVQQP